MPRKYTVSQKVIEHCKEVGFKKGNKPIITEESKRKMSIVKRGKSTWNKGLKGEEYLKHYKNIFNPMLGKHHSEETKRKMSEMRKGQNTWSRGRKLTSEHIKKIGLASKFNWKNIEYRNKVMNSLKKKWEDKKFVEKIRKAQLKGLFKRPTSLERRFIEIIQEHNLPFAYCGDGSLLIGCKNPDFYETNGKKICIEVRSKEVCQLLQHLSFQQYARQRKEHFAKYGWKCLIFWGKKNKLNENKIISNLDDVLSI